MNISIQKLLDKMLVELNQAKASSNEARIRERVHAIKALCELLLEDSDIKGEAVIQKSSYIVPTAVPTQPISLPQAKKIEMADEANGDSLFDF